MLAHISSPKTGMCLACGDFDDEVRACSESKKAVRSWAESLVRGEERDIRRQEFLAAYPDENEPPARSEPDERLARHFTRQLWRIREFCWARIKYDGRRGEFWRTMANRCEDEALRRYGVSTDLNVSWFPRLEERPFGEGPPCEPWDPHVEVIRSQWCYGQSSRHLWDFTRNKPLYDGL